MCRTNPTNSFSVAKHGSKGVRELLKPVFAQASANYPESLWKLYIINAPYLFRSLWGVIRMSAIWSSV